MLLSLGKKSTTNTQKNSPFPTSVPREGGFAGQPVTSIDPIETLDFKAAYVADLDKIVVEKKTPQAEEMFNQWIDQNQLNEAIKNKNKILFTDKKIIPTPSDSIHKLENKVKDFFQLMDDLNSIGKGSQQSNNGTIEQSPSPSSLAPNGLVPNPSMTYFAQCGDQGSLPLPDGGTLCSAGCGPTTVAMIASSYVNKQYNPRVVVNLYDKNNYLLGSGGSSPFNAYELLKQIGVKTTDYLVFNLEKSETVVPQLRKYLSAGWTFFAWAKFCDSSKGGCGHFFWITDIDGQGNIWAYDPAYGRYEIPYNENSRYPYPLYRLAFGVKK